eukprot:CAMPEP_0179244646 /NCGR_PEP_ID=MMETSP0797-20121207/18165_1 /TAXON_ID=47934 /ORGANISM="Dinophysis acuminata, Strain DAEP01" /LENGTH=226 /DNA_ID=CAMNT_0020952169 /DNA_START=72 /DNA_END=752 /DNA_ORIENTATION=-
MTGTVRSTVRSTARSTGGTTALQHGTHVETRWPHDLRRLQWRRAVDVDANFDGSIVVLANMVVQGFSHQSLAVKLPGGEVIIAEAFIDGHRNVTWQWECLDFDEYRARVHDMYLTEFLIGPVRTSISDLRAHCDSAPCIGQRYTASTQNCQCFVSEVVLGRYRMDKSRMPWSTRDVVAVGGLLGVTTEVASGLVAGPIGLFTSLLGSMFATEFAIDNIHATALEAE